MMKKLIPWSVLVGVCVAIPVVHQANPGLFDALLRAALTPEPSNTVESEVRVERAQIEAKAAPLSGRRVALSPDGKGHFVGEFRFNGRSQVAMVDTGATVVAFNRSMARRIGLQLTAADFRHKVKTANGEASAATALVSELTIGRIAVQNVQAVVLDDDALDTVLIGMSFLNRLSGFKVENGTLVLQQ